MKRREKKQKFILEPVPTNALLDPEVAYKDQEWSGWENLFRELYPEAGPATKDDASVSGTGGDETLELYMLNTGCIRRDFYNHLTLAKQLATCA